MGTVYGENNLKDYISINDYLNSSPDIDDFFYGAALGAQSREKRLEAERKAREKKEQDKLKKQTGGDHIVNDIEKGMRRHG